MSASHPESTRRRACELIEHGSSISAAADAVDADRHTVARWIGRRRARRAGVRSVTVRAGRHEWRSLEWSR